MVPEKSLNNPTPEIPVGILAGPTATGKTGIAIALAKSHGGIEIINADSLLVYRGLDIGTAKPKTDELRGIPHHLIDIRAPNEPFTAGEFMRETNQLIQDIHMRGKRALIVGGTGFYLKALLFGIWDAPAADLKLRAQLETRTNEELHTELSVKDLTSARRIGSADRYRLIRAHELIQLTGKTLTELQSEVPLEPNPRFTLWVLDRPSSELNDRIHLRTTQMLTQGLIEEFQSCIGQFPESRALQAIGYAQVHRYLSQQLPEGRKVKPGLAGLQDEIELATRQLVKQQRTWFRRQTQLTLQSQWFKLDEQRPDLEVAFNSIYSQTHVKN